MMRKGWGAVALVAALVPGALSAQSWKTVTMSRQLEDNDEVRVFVEYGAGHFTVRSVDEGLLYRMNLRYDEDKFEPVADFSGDRLHLGVETIGLGPTKCHDDRYPICRHGERMQLAHDGHGPGTGAA